MKTNQRSQIEWILTVTASPHPPGYAPTMSVVRDLCTRIVDWDTSMNWRQIYKKEQCIQAFIHPSSILHHPDSSLRSNPSGHRWHSHSSLVFQSSSYQLPILYAFYFKVKDGLFPASIDSAVASIILLGYVTRFTTWWYRVRLIIWLFHWVYSRWGPDITTEFPE